MPIGNDTTVVRILAPDAGNPQIVRIAPAQTLAFEFDVSKAEFTRSATDLIITGVNGGLVTLAGFFALNDTSVPNFALQDGTLLHGLDYLGSAQPGINTATVFGSALPYLGGSGEKVHEANLPAGTDDNPAALTQEIAVPQGYVVDVGKGGWVLVGNDVYQIRNAGEPGYLEYDVASRTLTYTLTGDVSHSGAGADSAAHAIPGITLVDASGNGLAFNAVLNIVDDVPELVFAGNSPSVEAGSSVFGTWSVDFGADGPDAGAPMALTVTRLGLPNPFTAFLAPGDSVQVVIDGTEYGRFTLNIDGTFAFAANPNRSGMLNFSLGARDGDGDLGVTDFLLGITDPFGTNMSHLPGENLFDEANLPVGTNPDDASLTKVVTTLVDAAVDVSQGGWRQSGNVYVLDSPVLYDANNNQTNGFGRLTYDPATLTLYYTLTGAVSHAAGSDMGMDVIPVVLIGGNLAFPTSIDVIVSIKDDAPILSLGGAASGADIESGDTFSGHWAHAFGADGPAAQGAFVVNVENQHGGSASYAVAIGVPCEIAVNGIIYGTMSLNANGTFDFIASPNVVGTLSFTVQVTDEDGDAVTSSPFELAIAKPSGPAPGTELGTGGDNFDEANLGNGTAPDAAALTKAIDIPAGYTLDAAASGFSQAGPGVYVKYDANGFLRYDAGANSLIYTLESPLTHPAQGADILDQMVSEVFLLDAKGNSYILDVKVSIVDDVPLVDIPVLSHDLTEAAPVVNDVLTIKIGADSGVLETATSISFALENSYGSLAPVLTPLTLQKDGTPLIIDTLAGRLTLVYDSAGHINYSYAGVKGLQGVTEYLNFVGTDMDHDITESSLAMFYKETVTTDPIAAMTDEAAIPGLGSSQGFSGQYADTVMLDPTLVLDNVTSITWQGPANPALYKADGNGDGVYQQVVWQQQGDSLVGYADNVAVITVEPEFAGGVFTGAITTTLLKPFQHDGINVADDFKSLELGMTQNSAQGQASLDFVVNIRDDSPMRDWGSATPIIDVYKAESHAESVYVVLDVSGSISAKEGTSAVNAIKALAQSYIDNGINTVISLVTFNTKATVIYNHVTPEDLIKSLNWCSIKHGGCTNYEVGLAQTMTLMEQGRNSADYSSWHQTVYFVSDGKQNSGDKPLTNWVNYRNAHQDDLDVYALNVEKCKLSAKQIANMVKVAGDSDNYYHVSSYDALLTQLVNLVHTEESGNLLGNIASADLTELYQVEYNNQTYTVSANGTTIELGGGVKITVFQNGDYTVTSGKLAGDVVKSLALVLKDADGDTFRTDANLIIRDISPLAHDNVSLAEAYTPTAWISNFCDVPAKAVNGCYKYQKVACGVDIPPISGFSSGAYGAMLVPAKYGDLYLSGIFGTTAAVSALFSQMGIVEQKYAYNAVMSMSFEQAGGEVLFNWAFKPGKSSASLDTAFWVLVDSSGNVVDCSKLYQGGDGKWHNGIASVKVPDVLQKYTLFIVQQEMGKDSTCVNSCMWLKDVVYIGDERLRSTGNVLTDASPDGQVDALAAGGLVYSLWYQGVEYVINGSATIVCDTGKLFIDAKGAYTFTAFDGVGNNIVEDFTYVIKDQTGKESSADLHIRSDDRTITGTDGDDQLHNLTSRDGDLIQGGDGNDTIYGGDGNEIIYGGAGNDLIYGGGGDDVIHGGYGNDTIYGGDGNDTIYGGAGNDMLFGGDGDDVLFGGTGNDILNGGAGDDILFAGSGMNILTGGTGADTFGWNKTAMGGKDIISDFHTAEGDRLTFSDLIDAGQSLNNFLNSKLDWHALSVDDRTISFTITEGVLSKDVEIHFQASDAQFDIVAAEYSAAANQVAEAQVLINFLATITA